MVGERHPLKLEDNNGRIAGLKTPLYVVFSSVSWQKYRTTVSTRHQACKKDTCIAIRGFVRHTSPGISEQARNTRNQTCKIDEFTGATCIVV